MIKTALITPPVGLHLYVVQGVHKSGRMADVMLIAAPQIAPYLPEAVKP